MTEGPPKKISNKNVNRCKNVSVLQKNASERKVAKQRWNSCKTNLALQNNCPNMFFVFEMFTFFFATICFCLNRGCLARLPLARCPCRQQCGNEAQDNHCSSGGQCHTRVASDGWVYCVTSSTSSFYFSYVSVDVWNLAESEDWGEETSKTCNGFELELHASKMSNEYLMRARVKSDAMFNTQTAPTN